MALAALPVELQKEVSELEHLRGALQDALIVEHDATAAAAKPPCGFSAVAEPHRTLDASTLRLLRSPNYPFALCEEAPSSYIPPPVPFDVEGEVERLKAGVLRIQEELLVYTDSLPNARHVAREGHRSQREATVPAITSAEVLRFLAGNPYYAELAFQVSALQWFHRWVLSHSVTLLCNAKEQLEYVLTERGQLVPDEVRVMDDCLREFAFPTAVSMLAADRQRVIAEERRRLHSASRTYRDRLPPNAISFARSSYLTTEEKYMYQEFYNQSEHTLLLYNHTSIAVQAPLLPAAQEDMSSGVKATEEKTRLVQERDQDGRGSSQGNSTRANSVNTLRSSLGPSPQDLRVLAEDLVNVLGAEREMITMLLDTIRERKAQGIVYDISPQDYQRSRRAQIAVYGCVVSDISLMSYQMHVAAEFLTRYEDWLRYHDLDSHDAVMARLCAMHTGIRWPALPSHDPSATSAAPHVHVRAAQLHDVAPARAATTAPTALPSLTETSHAVDNAMTTPRPQHPPPQPESSSSTQLVEKQRRARQPQETGRSTASQSTSSTGWNVAQPSTSRENGSPTVVSHPLGDAVREMPAAFIALLRAMETHDAAVTPGAESEPERGATCVVDAATLQERLWLMACLHHTIVQLATGAWATPHLTRQRLEEILGSSVRREAARLRPVAAALACVLHRLFTLITRVHRDPNVDADTATQTSAPTVTVIPVTVFMPSAVAASSLAQGEGALAPQRVALELLRRPSETARWGALLDALWFEADPTQRCSGGLCSYSADQVGHSATIEASAHTNKTHHHNFDSGPVTFQHLTSLRLLPAATPTSNAAGAAASRAGARLCATLQLHYDVIDRAAVSAKEEVPEYVTLATLLAHCPGATQGKSQGNAEGEASTRARCEWTRAVLRAFHEAEVHGVLPRYACRLAETPQVPLVDVLYLCRNTEKKKNGQQKAKGDEWRVCLPVPAGLELLRLHRHLGTHVTPVRAEVGTPFMLYESPRSWSTIGLLLADVFSQLALPAPPLTALFMLAANLRAASLNELENKLPTPAFSRTSATELMSVRCALHDDERAVSIQRDSWLSPSKTPGLIAPLLAEFEAHLARIDMH